VQLVHEVNTSRLTNLSVLTSIPTSGDAFTLGYVVGGGGTSGTKPLVIRAVGPSLAALGAPGTLDDPKLELFAGPAKTFENDNWGGADALSASMAQVGAFALASPASRDAALVVTLEFGNYSVEVSGVANTTGTALVEVYEVPSGSLRSHA
jgi:hypothetical protein